MQGMLSIVFVLLNAQFHTSRLNLLKVELQAEWGGRQKGLVVVVG